MLIKILAAFGAAAAVMLVLWALRGIMLTPVRIGKNAELELLIRVSGPCPELEDMLDALMWLRQNGTLSAAVRVIDRGMDCETEAMARLMERRGIITLETGEENEGF